MEERFELAGARLKEIVSEEILEGEYRSFFANEASYLVYLCRCYERIGDGELCKLDIDELREMNRKLYRPSIHKNGGAVDITNKYLRALQTEIESAVMYVFEQNLEQVLIRMELFLEMYSCFLAAKESGLEQPKDEELHDILYYYVSDYSLEATEDNIRRMVKIEEDYSMHLLKNCDWTDIRSLYYYGEYVTEVEEKTLKYVSALPFETLKKMADTFSEGYRIGFVNTGKDLSKKKVMEVRYHIGFEPMIRIAVENFEKMGLCVKLRRICRSLLLGRDLYIPGFEGACVDRQYVYEHKDDLSLIFDAKLKTVRLEALRKAFENHKADARLFAGPAVMEVFGEKPTGYVTKESAPTYSEEQQKLLIKYNTEKSLITNEYIIQEERSFTIIDFPTPDIGEKFEEIFDETIRLNTLDYKLYQQVQQKLIDTLDKGDIVIVKGSGDNKTRLKVSLHKLENPEKQTNFENCVADVNIPVGEVFTSPLLKGTEGLLHVDRVFLEGLEYKDLKIWIEDGMVSKYSCANFPSEEENLKYIKENLLFRFESLPIGEFAIGTNTTAYTMARKYDIEDILPILIAEKTGPHFAFGDTCYSHEEEVRTFNPDGKEIIARENEVSALRKTDIEKAYFNCHTDVTLPYDGLGELSVVTPDNEVITIIEDGRFVLPGTEILNEALEEKQTLG